MKLLATPGTWPVVELTLTQPHASQAVSLRGLYVQHGAELRQALSKLAPELDANDLLQEVFVVALRKPNEVTRAQSPRAWLYGVAVKLAATRRRTARVRRFLGLSGAEHVSAVDSPARSVEQRDAQRVVEAGLAQLSAAKRDVVVLFELRGLSGDEVSEALGIPLKTVWTRLFHARRELAAAIERMGAAS